MKETLTIDDLKVEIKKRFKTYSYFAGVAGIDRYEFQRDFLMKKSLDGVDKRLLNKIRKTLDGRNAEDKLKDLKLKVEEFGGVYFFCMKNPQFNNITLAQIMTGQTKTVSPVVQSLLDHFKIK